MEVQEIITLAAAVTTVANVVIMSYNAYKKNQPEIEKIEAEEESEKAHAAHLNVEGAVLSSNMLKERIDELQQDLTTEKRSRRDDAEYFRRRIKDIEKEARDYRLWAARLAKQVIEAGKVPVPFISSLNDTDPLISAITREQEELEKARGSREAELRTEEKK